MKRVITIAFVFVAFFCKAQIETDRPDFTESPNVVPKGALQIETGFIMENDYSAKDQRNSKIQLSERNIQIFQTFQVSPLHSSVSKPIFIKTKK